MFISKLVSGEVSESQLGAWLMATCIHGLNVQVNINASHVINANKCAKLKPSPGDCLANQGHGGERREPGVARGVETPRAGQAQHRGRRGQG